MSPDHYQQYTNGRGSKRWLDYTFDGFSYPEYRSQQEIDTQVTNGYVKIGVLRVNRSNRYDAYVSVNEMDEDIYIGSDLRRNRAFDGDIVAVEFIELEPVWNERKEARRRYASKFNNGDSNGSNEVEELENDEGEDEDFEAKPKYAGKVVGIVQKQKDRVFVGYLHVDRPTTDENQNDNSNEDARFWFQPLDRRAPLFYIPHANAPADVYENEEKYKNLLVVAKTISWLANKTRPAGKILRVLGQVGDVNVETKAILAECGIATEEFSPAALAALPPLPYIIPQAELSKRLDKRDTLTFTIDPSTAKDLDDALHITPLANGFEVGVHIADVSHFVRPNTPLDTEAKDRGTSTYLIDRVLPMLPEVLCQDLCSLNPGEDRLTFSVIWRMDTEARVLETSFAKSVIRSSAKLAYEDAQKVIDGGHLDPTIPRASEIEECIKNLMALARHRRRRRFLQGALALESLRLSFQLNSDGDPVKVGPYAVLDAHKLVEEFMLEANTSTAKKISESFPAESLLRRHRGPIIRRMDQFVSMAEKLGFHIDPESAGTLQRSFQAIPDGPVKQALLTLAIRPMQRAKYFCAGTLDSERRKHYALNEPVYTHFTSPIRRYADIIVHRQLDHALKSRKSSGYSKKSIQSITHHCNYRKELASRAEEQSSHLYLCRYLSTSSDPWVVSATVIVVEPDFIEIYQPTYGLKNRLFVEDMPLDRSEYLSDENTVVWYWKRGVTVDLETHIRRSHRTSRKKRANNDHDATPSIKSKPLCAPPRELIPSLIHKQHCTQKFSVFSTLNVRLQVNNHRSPPTVDAYPINPVA
ncbi:hypothetical protein BJV82DRAFT_512009 [Fennellomyces sp. T-0311]|nr:hypothetical protein BJV82DRAFT_512009 [Fennellomyces sp. T-0311]